MVVRGFLRFGPPPVKTTWRKAVGKKVIMEQAMERVGVPSQTILRNAVHRGELRAYRFGNSPRSRLWFDVDDLDEWVEQAEVEA
jgi:excisionase family DNA binding protein